MLKTSTKWSKVLQFIIVATLGLHFLNAFAQFTFAKQMIHQGDKTVLEVGRNNQLSEQQKEAYMNSFLRSIGYTDRKGLENSKDIDNKAHIDSTDSEENAREKILNVFTEKFQFGTVISQISVFCSFIFFFLFAILYDLTKKKVFVVVVMIFSILGMIGLLGYVGLVTTTGFVYVFPTGYTMLAIGFSSNVAMFICTVNILKEKKLTDSIELE